MSWRLPSTRLKMGNTPTVCKCGGQKFASKLEARHFADLVLLERAREIRDLRLQVPFELEAGIFYVADFVYHDIKPGLWRVDETKGNKTAGYIMKKKMFLNKYHGFTFREITR